MERELPELQSFDPARSDAPALPPTADGSPGVVLLLVAAAARADDWAERAAAALATGWADRGRRILLADLALARPGLHRVLDVGNGEGVSDAFLFGSSITRVARPVRDGRFLFVPAGTATARPEEVASSPRWASIVAACASVRATLVAFLPSDLPGGEALLRWGTDVLLLTDPAGHEELAQGLGDRLRGILTPPNGRIEHGMPGSLASFGAPAPDVPVDAALDPAAAFTDERAAAVPSAEPAPGEAGVWTQPIPLVSAELEPETAGAGELWEPAATELLPHLAFERTESAPVDLDEGLPVLDGAPGEPEPTVVDPWAANEPGQQRAAGEGEALGADVSLEIELGRTEISAPAGAGEAAPSDLMDGLDFADIQPSPELLAPVSATPEPEQPSAAAFEGSSIDGRAEPPLPPTRPPEVLDAEGPPIVGDALAPPAPHEQLLAGGDVAGLELSGAAAPPRSPEPATRPRTVDRPRPTPRPAARPAPKPVERAKGAAGLVGAIVIAVLLLAVVALAWFDVVEIPWLSDFIDARRPQPVSSAPAPAELAPPSTARDVLGASLALGAFTDAPVARLQAEALTQQQPDLLFVVAPVVIGGLVRHRLLVGPARDSAEAATLRVRLAVLLTREDPRSWPTLSTPLAFSLGETSNLEAARLRVDALSRVDIPAYVLELPAPTGPPGAGPFVQARSVDHPVRYRVYAGAYADANEAAYLAELLAREGESRAPLIERTGRHIE